MNQSQTILFGLTLPINPPDFGFSIYSTDKSAFLQHQGIVGQVSVRT